MITNRKSHSIGSNYRTGHPGSTHRNHGPSVSVLKNSQEKDAGPIFNHLGTRQDSPCELPSIEIDVTSYAKKESFGSIYKRVSADIDRENKNRKTIKSFPTSTTAGFEESFFYGFGLVFKFIGKAILFLIYALTAMYFMSKCF